MDPVRPETSGGNRRCRGETPDDRGRTGGREEDLRGPGTLEVIGRSLVTVLAFRTRTVSRPDVSSVTTLLFLGKTGSRGTGGGGRL